jgi:hypothetical protein
MVAGHVAGKGETRITHRILVRKPLGSSRREWEYKINMDLSEIYYDD